LDVPAEFIPADLAFMAEIADSAGLKSDPIPQF